MKKLLLLTCFLVCCIMYGQDYQTLTVTSGFNQDVIANGSGDAAASTTIGVDNANYAYMSTDFVSPGGVSAPAGALPANGTLTSANVTGLSYQFADYSGDNCLRINTQNESGTLLFSEQVSATDVYMLVTSGSGSSTMQIVVNFTDGTTQIATGQFIPDWYNGTALPVAMQNIGRVSRNDNIIQTPFNNPRIYQLSIAIDAANQTKIIEGITATKTSAAAGVFNLFAVSAKTLGPCPTPEDASVNTITENEATVTWSEPVVLPSGYNYYYSTEATEPNDTTVPSGSTTSTDVTLSALDANTTYYVWIQSDCDTEQGPWIGPVSFQTLCVAFDIPFTEGFNSTSETQNCWTVLNENGDGDAWNMDYTTNPFEGDHSAMMYTDFNNGNNDDYLITPGLNLTGNQRLKFHYRVQSSGEPNDFEILLSTTGTAAADFTTEVMPLTAVSNTTYQEMIINLPSITGTAYIAFRVPPGGLDGWRLYVDNVIVEDIPPCPDPTNLMVSNITTTSAELSWTNGYQETEWLVIVQQAGQGAPSSSNPNIVVADSNPFTVTGLEAGGSYEFYLLAYCNDVDQSNWIGPVAFETTLCEVEDQCSYTFNLTDSWGDGWNGNTMDVIQNGITIATLSLSSGSAGSQTVMICEGIPFTLHWNNGGSFANEVGVSITADATSTEVFNMPSGNAPLRGTDLYSDYSVCSPITCPVPTDVTVTNVTSSTVDISWIAGGSETEWEVVVLPVGAPYPTEGTTVTTTSYTYTDLDPSTDYNVYVMAVCGDDDMSFWTIPVAFETAIGNDDCATPYDLVVNSDDTCTSVTPAVFTGATVSPEADSCADQNSGDIWFQFTATNDVHEIKLQDFDLDMASNPTAEAPSPIVMTMYEGTCDAFTELYCSTINNILATNLVPGQTYVLRITDNNPNTDQTTEFNICVNVPTPPDNMSSFDCLIYTVNSDFEEPDVTDGNPYPAIINHNVIPGWRTTASDEMIEVWEQPNYEGVPAYSGTQFIELNANEVSAVYQDYETPLATTFTYAFAHRGRQGTDTCELLAGPPGGPYESVTVVQTSNTAWSYNTGQYTTPANQPITRFVFQSVSSVGGASVGNYLDAISFTANNGILSPNPATLDCENNIAEVLAAGTGVWTIHDDNPADTTIEDASSNETTISGFTVPGIYRYEWTTLYCSATLEIVYNEQNVEFSYVDQVCYNGDNQLPVLSDGFIAGGTFTSTTGLVIDEITGEIDVLASTAGTYTVTYNIPGEPESCLNTNTADITILEELEVMAEGSCQGVSYVVAAYAADGSSLDNVTYEWSGPNGFSSTAQNAVVEDLGLYSVMVTNADGCVSEASVTVESVFCAIPEGISPQGDEFNQSFDLSGLGVSEIKIFNRLGTEVYSRSNYTNEWEGQSNNGNLLPVGTYYYVLKFSDGRDQITGWVYVNY